MLRYMLGEIQLLYTLKLIEYIEIDRYCLSSVCNICLSIHRYFLHRDIKHF